MVKFVNEKEREIYIKQTREIIKKTQRFNSKYPKYADTEKLERNEKFLEKCLNNYEIVKA